MTESKQFFAENLNRLMNEQQLSRKDLANSLNIPYTTLTNWAKGARQPKIEMMETIAEFFHISLSQLLEKQDKDTELLLSVFHQLNENHRHAVINFTQNELITQKKNQHKILPLEPKIPMVEMDYYGSVSAGVGLYLGEENKESIEVPEEDVPSNADFVLSIHGDSMEPDYHDGEILYIKKQETIFNGTLGIFILNGEGFFKRIWFKKNHAILESLNDEYDDLIVTEDDHFVIVGKVLN
ncbi:Helix-turn-helix [Pilibacter termitis]|uniref:Helix-turn-helix n=1 Tax=Pilibacter termitis TaxID=263852 RepID=A0A1T4L2K2_9ENTE|nr:XRE family transcriptional regulator [Pilibacter termitis]SJZ48982.1 Helix-turn-helix [Pilibacter termitis]